MLVVPCHRSTEDLKSTEKASELNMIAERHLESNDPNLSNLESSGIKRHGSPAIYRRHRARCCSLSPNALACTIDARAHHSRSARAPLAAGWRLRLTSGVLQVSGTQNVMLSVPMACMHMCTAFSCA